MLLKLLPSPRVSRKWKGRLFGGRLGLSRVGEEWVLWGEWGGGRGGGDLFLGGGRGKEGG